MKRFIDIRGKRFGKLVVIEETGRDKWGSRLWKCKCDCGGYNIATTRNLTTGNTKSCGCLFIEKPFNSWNEEYKKIRLLK